MRQPDLSGLTDDELVKIFALAAKRRGLAVLDSETRQANKMFDRMRSVDAVLRTRGLEARMRLVPLLDHDDRFIRYYAALYLLAVVPARARAIIEWNHKYWFDALAGDAGMTLQNLDTGIYRPD
jgi:hypothetical protein